ncbi:XRE family transcriptional regulator OS=Streptomyces alboniger OX=132473 GN=CP975_01595 PE=4 SV=1 [Streptomyces alboniger]
MNKTALRALLRERRALIAPEAHGFSRPRGQGRRAPGLSQHQVDQLLHRTFGTYHRLESGNYPNPPNTLLRDVARLFGLNEQEWVSLNRYASSRTRRAPCTSPPARRFPGVWQEAVDGISHMAYVTDASWDMLAFNKPLAAMFPEGNVPANVMRWMVLDPDGRRALMNWHAAWAPMVLPQLRAALASRPDDDTLLQIEKEVLADPETADLYRRGVSYPHPDGDERPLFHPEQGPGWVTMCTAQPMTAPGARR